MEQNVISQNGYSLFTRQSVTDKGLALIFVHGLAVSGNYWLPLADVLQQDYDLYIPDLPGFGASAHPERPLTIRELADELAAYITRIDPAQAVLVGNSLGCQIIIDLLSRQNDDRIVGAVLSGPSVNMYERTMLKQSLRWLQATMYEPVSEYGMLLADYVRAGPRQIYRTFQYAVQDEPESKARAISQPVLLLRGSQDLLVPRVWLDELAGRLQRAQIAEVQGRGHLAHLIDPPQTAEQIRAFIATKIK